MLDEVEAVGGVDICYCFVAATVQQQQATVATTAASPKVTGMATATTLSRTMTRGLRWNCESSLGRRHTGTSGTRCTRHRPGFLSPPRNWWQLTRSGSELRTSTVRISSRCERRAHPRRGFPSSPPAKARCWKSYRAPTRLVLRGGSCCNGITPVV